MNNKYYYWWKVRKGMRYEETITDEDGYTVYKFECKGYSLILNQEGFDDYCKWYGKAMIIGDLDER